jgi:hypothetical protein
MKKLFVYIINLVIGLKPQSLSHVFFKKYSLISLNKRPKGLLSFLKSIRSNYGFVEKSSYSEYLKLFFIMFCLLILLVLLVLNMDIAYAMNPDDFVKDQTLPKSESPLISVNLTDALKYVGAGAAAAGVGTGVAQVFKLLPPQTRAGTLIIGTGLLTSGYVLTETIRTIYTKRNHSSPNLSIIKKLEPNISGKAEIKIGEQTKVQIESTNNPLITSSSNENLTSFDSSQVSSIFEFNFLSSYIENDPFLVLFYCVLFISCIGLYTLIALNIGYVIKYSLNKYYKKFKNPIIIKIISFYSKYNTALFWFWFLALYCSFIMLIIISIVLIDQYPIINSHTSEEVIHRAVLLLNLKTLAVLKRNHLFEEGREEIRSGSKQFKIKRFYSIQTIIKKENQYSTSTPESNNSNGSFVTKQTILLF